MGYIIAYVFVISCVPLLKIAYGNSMDFKSFLLNGIMFQFHLFSGVRSIRGHPGFN